MNLDPALLDDLEKARPALEALPVERLAAAWAGAIGELRRPPPGSPAAGLRKKMAAALGFSEKGLAAGLELVLDSVAGNEAVELLATSRRGGPGPLLAILAATPPGLAAQAILPALALRRPMLVKSASAEPDFAPLLIGLLAAREPVLGETLAAATWRGGESAGEDQLLGAAGHVVAYGGGAAMAAIAPRCASFFGFGPKISLAILGKDADPAAVAPGIARDVALFDQRGCLSVQLVLTAGDAVAVAWALAAALEEVAEALPPGPADPAALAERRLLREEAALRGLVVPPLPLRLGTVVAEEEGAALLPSPGGRTVRIYPLASAREAVERLRPWRGLLQGVALNKRVAPGEAPALNKRVAPGETPGESGEDGGLEDDLNKRVAPGEDGEMDADWTRWLAPALRELGVTRVAALGELQRAGLASWPNGGRPALEIFAAWRGAPL